jgi:hypothetical protein
VTLLQYLWACYQAYRAARLSPPNNVTYFAIVPSYCEAPPTLAVLIGRGREAWRISQIAIEHKLTGRRDS